MQRCYLKLQQQFKENYKKGLCFWYVLNPTVPRNTRVKSWRQWFALQGPGQLTERQVVHLQMEKLNILGKIQMRVKEIRGVTDFFLSLNKAWLSEFEKILFEKVLSIVSTIGPKHGSCAASPPGEQSVPFEALIFFSTLLSKTVYYCLFPLRIHTYR